MTEKSNTQVGYEHGRLLRDAAKQAKVLKFQSPTNQQDWYRHAYENMVKACNVYYSVNKRPPASIHEIIRFLSVKAYGKEFIDKVSLML